MRDITVGQLRNMLEELDNDDLVIRVAEQPTYPLQLAIWDEIRLVNGVAYLRTSEHPNEGSPYAPRACFGDEDVNDRLCLVCGEDAEGSLDDDDDTPLCDPCGEKMGRSTHAA